LNAATLVIHCENNARAHAALQLGSAHQQQFWPPLPPVLQAAKDPDISIPPLKVPLVYGMACSIQFLLPAAYWYAAFYAGRSDHFEAAVLAAVNSGGNNMARAALTGGLVGAMVGLSGACCSLLPCAWVMVAFAALLLWEAA
jgi:hypothetical protein